MAAKGLASHSRHGQAVAGRQDDDNGHADLHAEACVCVWGVCVCVCVWGGGGGVTRQRHGAGVVGQVQVHVQEGARSRWGRRVHVHGERASEGKEVGRWCMRSARIPTFPAWLRPGKAPAVPLANVHPSRSQHTTGLTPRIGEAGHLHAHGAHHAVAVCGHRGVRAAEGAGDGRGRGAAGTT